MKIFKVALLVFLISTSSFGKEKEKEINLNELSETARLETKHTLLFFHMSYCPYCKRMKKFVFKDKSIKDIVNNNFLFVDINVDDDDIVIYKKFKDTKREFANNLNISFYPTVVFLDEENEVVYILKGYRSKGTFKKVLLYVKEKHYIDMEFSEYLNELEFEN